MPQQHLSNHIGYQGNAQATPLQPFGIPQQWPSDNLVLNRDATTMALATSWDTIATHQPHLSNHLGYHSNALATPQQRAGIQKPCPSNILATTWNTIAMPQQYLGYQGSAIATLQKPPRTPRHGLATPQYPLGIPKQCSCKTLAIIPSLNHLWIKRISIRVFNLSNLQLVKTCFTYQGRHSDEYAAKR